jgi:excisionase family DNA binding protein
VSVKLVYRLVATGKLKAVKVGRSVRIHTASVLEFIERNTVGGGQQPPPARPAGPTPTPRPASARLGKTDPAGFVFLPRPRA